MAEQAESGGQQSVGESDAADMAAYLAELKKPVNGTSKAAPEDTDTETEATDQEDADEGAAEDESTDDAGESDGEDADETDDAAEDADEESDDDAADTKADAPKDADTSKRLEAVQKAERRAKEQLREETRAAHAEIDARVAKIQAEWEPKVKAAERFTALQGRVRYNTVAVLRELGLGDEDFERVAQEVYAHSKAAGLKPEHKAHAERAARERELADDLAATKKRLDERDAADAKRDQDAKATATAERFMASVEKAAGDKAPLAKHFLAKNPDRARMRFAAIAEELIGETGGWPEPGDVLARFEKAQREDLEAIGVDPTAFIKNGAKKPTNGKSITVEVKKPTNGTKAKPKAPPRPKTDEEERDEILREIAEMNAKDSDATA